MSDVVLLGGVDGIPSEVHAVLSYPCFSFRVFPFVYVRVFLLFVHIILGGRGVTVSILLL